MRMKRLHRRSDLKRTGFSAGRENPRSIGFILREVVFLRFASAAKWPRRAAIFRGLQMVCKCYRLDGGEGGIRTPETLSSLHAFQACALNRARPPLRIEGVSTYTLFAHDSSPRPDAVDPVWMGGVFVREALDMVKLRRLTPMPASATLPAMVNVQAR